MKRTAARSLAAALMPALLLSLAAAAAAAGFDSASAGTSSGQFLRVAAGARGAAMGEAWTALGDDAFVLDWNPAGLINIRRSSMVLMHSPHLAGAYADYFAYAETAGEVGAWGVSLKYMNYGKIERTDSAGVTVGKFAPYDTAVSVGFACYITGFNKDPQERFVLGATGKFVKSKIVSDDNTVSADIGLLTPGMFDNRFLIGLSAQNIMGTLRYDKEDAPLPLVLRFGTLTRLGEYLNLTADIVSARDSLPYLAMGAEARVAAHKELDVFLRSGFNTRAIADLGGLRNVSLGAGVRLSSYNFDYAFSPFGDLGTVHRLSAGIAF